MRESVYVKRIHRFKLMRAESTRNGSRAFMNVIVFSLRAFPGYGLEAEPAFLILRPQLPVGTARFVIALDGAEVTVKVGSRVKVFAAFFASVRLMII